MSNSIPYCPKKFLWKVFKPANADGLELFTYIDGELSNAAIGAFFGADEDETVLNKSGRFCRKISTSMGYSSICVDIFNGSPWFGVNSSLFLQTLDCMLAISFHLISALLRRFDVRMPDSLTVTLD